MPVTLFFDLDKTLCHPRAPFIQVFTESCAPLLDATATDGPARVSALLHAWAEALDLAGPSTTAACLGRALALARIPASEQLITQCASSLVAAWSASQRPGGGVMATLEQLAKRYPLGLITNGPSDSQHAVIRALQLEGVFRWRIVSGDASIGVRKPHPAIFERALALSGSLPRNTWYIGDSPENDIAGAAAAGWRTCWLSAPGDDFPDELPQPDARIIRLDELPRVLSDAGHA